MKFKVTRIWYEVEADGIEAAVARTQPADVELRAASQHEYLKVERWCEPQGTSADNNEMGDEDGDRS